MGRTRQQEMIDDIRAAEGALGDFMPLSQWEGEFIESVEDRLSDRRALTVEQIAKLEEIWRRV